MQLPNGSVWPWRRTKNERKTGEDGNYQTTQANFFKSRNEIARPVLGIIFLVVVLVAEQDTKFPRGTIQISVIKMLR